MAWATVDQLRQYLHQVGDLGAQRITLDGATGGTFVLSYEGSNSSALAYNATATTVQTALRAISAIGSSGIKVTGRPGEYLAQFLGQLATDAGPITADGALLTGTTPTIAVESATDDLLSYCLDRSTDIVRSAIRAQLADDTFDYTAFGAADTRIARGVNSMYLRLAAHQADSVTLVELESGGTPLSYTEVDSDLYVEEGYYLYRPSGWSSGQRYRVTAVWGAGATVPPAIEEVVLEIAVNIWRSRDTGGFIDTIGQDGQPSVRAIAGLTSLQKTTIQSVAGRLIDIGV